MVFVLLICLTIVDISEEERGGGVNKFKHQYDTRVLYAKIINLFL